MPELLWKRYIDFEVEEGERERARALYERLVVLSGHVKVWISYALFEAEPMAAPRSTWEEDEDGETEVKMVEGDLDIARRVFDRAYQDLKSKGLKEEVCLYSLVNCALHADHILATCSSTRMEEAGRGARYIGRRREGRTHDACPMCDAPRRQRDGSSRRRCVHILSLLQ